jgi:hypothetical protein
MKLAVNRAQVLAIDVSVNLRGRDIDVTEHLLDRPQVRAAFEQMRRKGVTQRVR